MFGSEKMDNIIIEEIKCKEEELNNILKNYNYINKEINNYNKDNRKIKISNCMLMTIETISILLCNGFPQELLLTILCTEFIICKYLIIANYGTKRGNDISKRKNIIELENLKIILNTKKKELEELKEYNQDISKEQKILKISRF